MVEAPDPAVQERSSQPEVCEASIAAARLIADELFREMSNRGSVLHYVMADRASRMPPEAQLGIAPSLLVDPTRSGIVVARYQVQSGKLPADAVTQTPEQAISLWAVQEKGDIPPLQVPEGQEERVMEVADKLQMRGGGPVIFAREEAARVPVTPSTLINVIGGARNANRERLRTALAVVEAHQDYTRPILVTTDPLRVLKPDERKAVTAFAPDASNEMSLVMASAIQEGFTPDPSNLYGNRYLPDGSSYLKMIHENGHELIVLAPVRQYKDGIQQSGVFNAYTALLAHGGDIIPGFSFEGSEVLQVNSTHYGTMGVLNNLRAVHELRTHVGSFHVVGDNQPARNAQAHLVEIGYTFNAISEAVDESPAIKSALTPAAS